MTPTFHTVSTHATHQIHNGSRLARVQALRASSPWQSSSVATKWLAVAALAVGSLLASAVIQPAHANNLVWSVGVQAPGAVVHVGNSPYPRVVHQYPYPAHVPSYPVASYPVTPYPVTSYPVVVAPQPWYAPPPPRPVQGWYGSHGYGPRDGYGNDRHRHGHRHHHGRGHDRDWDDRR